MPTKRKPIHSPTKTQMNFRTGLNENAKNEAKGTRPTAPAATVKEVLVMMIMHICKKTIFFDINLKVAIYLGSLFLISLIGDFIPYPKTYFARSDNLFNQYFVKRGWGWTLILSTPFMILTSATLNCGNFNRSMRSHLPRLVIATFFWYIWTNLFNKIEAIYGRCNVKTFDTKPGCLASGHFWHGFDISGHAFILIYSSLVLIEEARPIMGWENIKEHLRNEEYNRSTQDTSLNTNPLRNLKEDEFKKLKDFYTKYTPVIKLLFIAMTVLQLLWDVMLVCTMLYYHRMIEKLVSGIFAIFTWFFTYRAWYPSTLVQPDSPGRGLFNYQKLEYSSTNIPLRRQSLINQTNSNLGSTTSTSTSKPIPKFMGMPLYTTPEKAFQVNVDAPSTGTAGISNKRDKFSESNFNPSKF